MAFAIVQNGYAIFGVGYTLEAAYRDAEEWTQDLPPLDKLPNTTANHGGMFWAKITNALAAEVAKRGGDIAWGELPDGILCTLQEHETRSEALENERTLNPEIDC